MDDDTFRKSIDLQSPTWIALMEWLVIRKTTIAVSLLNQKNDRETDLIAKGKAGFITELMSFNKGPAHE